MLCWKHAHWLLNLLIHSLQVLDTVITGLQLLSLVLRFVAHSCKCFPTMGYLLPRIQADMAVVMAMLCVEGTVHGVGWQVQG